MLVEDCELFDELLVLALTLEESCAELEFVGAMEFEDPHATNSKEARQKMEIFFMCRRYMQSSRSPKSFVRSITERPWRV